MSVIVFTRHVLVLAVGSLLAVSFSRARLSWEGWLAMWGICAAAGLLSAGLASLFFTSSQARHWRVNSIIAAWVLIGFTTFGDMQSWNSPRTGPSVPAVQPAPPAPAQEQATSAPEDRKARAQEAGAFDPSTAKPVPDPAGAAAQLSEAAPKTPGTQQAEANFITAFPDVLADPRLVQLADRHYEDVVRENPNISYGAALMEAGFRTRRALAPAR